MLFSSTIGISSSYNQSLTNNIKFYKNTTSLALRGATGNVSTAASDSDKIIIIGSSICLALSIGVMSYSFVKIKNFYKVQDYLILSENQKTFSLGLFVATFSTIMLGCSVANLIEPQSCKFI